MSHQPKTPVAAEVPNPLHISWHDSAVSSNQINRDNVLDYFAERSNPFYDTTCNNQVVKMQRISPEHLVNMQGTEYVVVYAQEPLFVVRKQYRSSPTQVSVLSNYYVIAGVVYQAPDLASVINSRVLSATHALRAAFKEALSYSRYHPAKGYWWEFPGSDTSDASSKNTIAEAPAAAKAKSTAFQRTRVDALLADLVRRFPPVNAELEQAKAEPHDTRPATQTRQAPTQPEDQPALKRIKTEPSLITQ